MVANTSELESQPRPAIGIHIIDIVQPPAIPIPPAIDRTKYMVALALTTKSAAAETCRAC